MDVHLGPEDYKDGKNFDMRYVLSMVKEAV